MEGQINCMHSKLMLLFYPTHLRVVVPTANLVPYDWGEPFGDLEGGVMENTVFLVDLPKRCFQGDEQQNAEIPFLQSLLYFLKAMNLQEDVMGKLQNYDFSKLAQHGFVHSIGGSHYGDAWRETGLCGLGQFLHNLGLRTFGTIEIDYVMSSVGSLDDEYLRSLYLIAQGDSGLAEYTNRTAKSMPPSVSHDLNRRLGREFPSGWKQHFRFYYPSDATVKASKGGPGCGGTICFNSRWWNGPKFPRGLIRDCQSQRDGMLMHNKVSQPISRATRDLHNSTQIWFTRYEKPVAIKSGQQALGWAYVGSANLSESAW
jgi:Tyrosyl-DNA phosphodiesterase